LFSLSCTSQDTLYLLWEGSHLPCCFKLREQFLSSACLFLCSQDCQGWWR